MITRIGSLLVVMGMIAPLGLAAQIAGKASGKLGNDAFEGVVSCEFGEKIKIVTHDGGRTDNDGDGFAMLLRGETDKGFTFTVVVDDATYTGFAQGVVADEKLLISAPELEFLDGHGKVPTLIEVDCGDQ